MGVTFVTSHQFFLEKMGDLVGRLAATVSK